MTEKENKAVVTRFLIAAVLVGVVGAMACAVGAQEVRPDSGDQCIVCHRAEDYLPEGYGEDDVHLAAGLTCAGCHGGDPTSSDEETAMSEEAGFVGAPVKEEIPGFCGRCHSDIDFMRQYRPRIATDQLSQYRTSIHGKRLEAGDSKVADCTSCHTAHHILPAGDTRSSVHPLNVPATCDHCHGDPEYMKEYGIPTTQYDNYAAGVHGVALLEKQDTGSPACNDCHGNHGAMPPGITSIRQVCGNCHVNNMQYFVASKMGEAFAKEELHGCEECHGNHRIEKTHDDMIGIGEEAVCMDCHAEGEKGYEAARSIHDQLVSLVSAYDEAEAKRDEVERIGMDDVEIGFLMQESHQSLIQARTLVHTFDPARVGPKTEEGVAKAQEALQLAKEQIEEFGVRQRGFGMATVFITILVVALFFKIRHLDGK